MIQYGKIVNFRYKKLGDGKKLELKVQVDERLTNWLPIKTKASSFLVEHLPVRVGDQVLVFNPFGDNEDGFVDRNITYKDIPLPANIDENKHYISIEDGTTYIHDTKNKKISLNTPCEVNLKTLSDLHIEAKNITIKATNTNFVGGSVTHDGVTIDKTHTHTQNSGNHYGGGAVTTPPNG